MNGCIACKACRVPKLLSKAEFKPRWKEAGRVESVEYSSKLIILLLLGRCIIIMMIFFILLNIMACNE